jgi:class 3 adenylate cyclase/tetratricopeptide (TPR) repeat protein
MQCPSCSHNNDPSAKFCSECGTKLAPVCPNGHEVAAGAKFCSECGEAVEVTQPAAPAEAPVAAPTVGQAPARAERRLVTVLFADLVGFTPYSESRDPEEVRAMLTVYFDRASEILERFAGSVDKFIGDAVMAVWGAVAANEDDAERAVRAGLELVDMIDELGDEIGVPELALRAGVLTGEASVGPGGNEKGLVVGDLVNTASRLQSIAEPGTVAIGESTFRIVESSIACEPLGDKEMKGKSSPVPAYRALRVISERGGRGKAAGIEAPFVGREDELRLLKDQLHATGRDGRARLVSIVGEGGIGKSRLAAELLRYIDGLAENFFWHQGRSPSYGDGLTFWALGEMVRRRAGIAEGEEPHKSRIKLRTSVAEFVPDQDEQKWIEPRLAGLLGLDEMPAGDRTELFAAMRTFFQRIADQGPTVLVFEDLHWADAGLLDFIEELVDRSRSHPIFVLTLARPDLLEIKPGWGSGRQSLLSMHLPPLPEHSMRELVAGLAPGMPNDAVELIAGRAAGMPLYAVEFVRMLLAGGDLVRDGEEFRLVGDLAELAVPESLQAVIGARLDRLDTADRDLAQDGAVLGQTFTIDGLSVLRHEEPDELESRLRELVHNELLEVEADPKSPERGMYKFVQGLIREVAYSRLTREERRDRHMKVAEYYGQFDDVEMAGIVASHYVDAYRASPAGTEAEALADRARHALRDAAGRAADLQSHEQALTLCKQALDITVEAADQAELWLRAAEAANLALLEDDEAVRYATDALDYFRGIGNDDGVVRAARLLAHVLNDHYRSDEAPPVLEPVFEELSVLETPDEIALGAELSRTYMLTGSYEKSVEIAERVLLPAEQLELVPMVVDTLITRATALGSLGRPKEGVALLEGAIELAEDYDLPQASSRALNNLGVILGPEEAKAEDEANQRLYEHAKRVGDTARILDGQNTVALQQMANGDMEGAVEILRGADVSEMSGQWPAVFGFWGAFTEALLTGEPRFWDEAEEHLTFWDESTDPQVMGLLAGFRTWTNLYRGDYEGALRAAAETEWDPPFPFRLHGAIHAAAALENSKELERARTELDGLSGRGRRIKGLRLQGEAAAASLAGDQAEAARLFSAAVELWEQAATPLELTLLRATFARMVGQDEPAAAQAAQAAYDWVVESKSVRLLELLADGLPAAPTAEAASG